MQSSTDNIRPPAERLRNATDTGLDENVGGAKMVLAVVPDIPSGAANAHKRWAERRGYGWIEGYAEGGAAERFEIRIGRRIRSIKDDARIVGCVETEH